MATIESTVTAPEERRDRQTKDTRPIIDARKVAVTFKVENGTVEAVKDVSFQLYRGETIAIVGESGSGKSVTARTVMGLCRSVPPSPRTRASNMTAATS